MQRLNQKSGESTDYGSTYQEEGSTHSTSTPNRRSFFQWPCRDCTSEQLQLHNAAISGIIPEYGNTIGDSLIVPYLLELGAPVWSTSLVWVVTPFFDSWLQPIYGKMSDKCTATPNACCRLGGRKPFILLFATLATIGLIVIPQARLIQADGHIAAAVIVCILSYTLMDMSHGDMLIPTRSLLNDLCNDAHLIQYGNEKFTFYQAIGRCLGYLVVSIDWKQMISDHSPKFMALLAVVNLDHQIAICFTLSVVVIWIITLFVIVSTPYQIERLHRLPKQRPNLHIQYPSTESKPVPPISNEMLITPSGRIVVMHPTIHITETITSLVSSEGFSRFDELREPSVSNDFSSPSSVRLSPVEESKQKQIKDEDFVYNPFANDHEPGAAVRLSLPSVTDPIYDGSDSSYNDDDVPVEHQEPPSLHPGLSHLTTGSVVWSFPRHFKLLWTIQFFGWQNFAAFSLYFTSFVAIDIFNGEPDAADPESLEFGRFVKGVRVATSILFMSAVIAAISGKFIIPFLNRRFGVKLTFFVGELVLNALLVILIWNNNSVVMVVLIVAVYGVAIQIHYSNVFIIVERDLRSIFKTESRRAYVLSIFNLSILFANVMVSICAGFVVNAFNNTFVAGISFFGGIGLIGDAIVYAVFFWKERRNMMDSHRLRGTMEPNAAAIDSAL